MIIKKERKKTNVKEKRFLMFKLTPLFLLYNCIQENFPILRLGCMDRTWIYIYVITDATEWNHSNHVK